MTVQLYVRKQGQEKKNIDLCIFFNETVVRNAPDTAVTSPSRN